MIQSKLQLRVYAAAAACAALLAVGATLPAVSHAQTKLRIQSAFPAKGTFGPADPVVQQGAQQAIITAGSQGSNVAKVAQAGDNGIAQTESAVQPLAALNAPANQAIDAAASATNTVATAAGPQIQPLDTTVKQGGQFLGELKAQPGG